MNHQSVAPLNIAQGVRVTSGRSPANPDRQPSVSEEARRLLAALPGISESLVTTKSMAAFAARQTANPSAAGVQALAYLAWSCREAARKKYPADAADELTVAEALAKLSAGCAAVLEARAAGERLLAEVGARMKAAVTLAFDAGKQAAKKQLEADATKPVLERRVEFVMDSRDRVVGKIEREFKPGGKS